MTPPRDAFFEDVAAECYGDVRLHGLVAVACSTEEAIAARARRALVVMDPTIELPPFSLLDGLLLARVSGASS